MKRYLLDSGIASDFVNARGPVRARVVAAARAGHRIGLGTPILGELIGGVMASNDPIRYGKRLRQEIAPLRLWSFDAEAANEYGRLYAELRGAGRLMQVPDMQLAAIARALGDAVVVTKDSDLSAVPGLDVENWSV
jgi:tRNA(fMet)-specific endonuclease VapC